jgi:hypothetical protein
MDYAGWIALFSALIIGGGALFRAVWVISQSQFSSVQTQLQAISDRVTALEGDIIHTGEHREFVERVDQYMSTPFHRQDSFEAWKSEHDVRIRQIDVQLTRLEQCIIQGMRDSISKPNAPAR